MLWFEVKDKAKMKNEKKMDALDRRLRNENY
jgi:hypothetical protein